jgi:hypothetical protein
MMEAMMKKQIMYSSPIAQNHELSRGLWRRNSKKCTSSSTANHKSFEGSQKAARKPPGQQFVRGWQNGQFACVEVLAFLRIQKNLQGR